MEFSGQVGAYIGTSRPTKGRDAPQHNILPFGWAGCSRRDLFANKIFAKRPSGNLPPAGWAGGPRPHASAGGRCPFLKIFLTGTLFRILIFFNPFLKKKLNSICTSPAHLTDQLHTVTNGPAYCPIPLPALLAHEGIRYRSAMGPSLLATKTDDLNTEKITLQVLQFNYITL
jgi:hypothetical protein